MKKEAALFALLSMAASAQVPTGYVWPQDCTQRVGEDDDARYSRCQQEATIETYGKQLETQRQMELEKAALNREPALAAAKNPLLGRWSLPAVDEGRADDLLSQIPALLKGLECGPLIGSAEVEFLPDRMISIASDGERSPESVGYRGRKNGVFVVMPPGRPLLFFRLLTKDRVQLGTVGSCVLTRNGKAVAAGSGAAAAPVSRVPDANRAYSCPDGSLALIVSCDDASASAYCTVEFPSLPKAYGRYPYEIAQRSAIAARAKDCKAGSVRFDSVGKAIFVPGAQ